jgi:hypothetical protein
VTMRGAGAGSSPRSRSCDGEAAPRRR